MQSDKERGNEIIRKMEEVEASFDDVLTDFDKQRYGVSVDTALKVVSRLEQVVDQLREDYSKVLLERKVGSLAEEKKTLASLKKNEFSGITELEYFRVLERLQASIRSARREVRRNYSYDLKLVVLAKKYIKQVQYAVGAVIAVAALIFLIGALFPSKKGLKGEYFYGLNFEDLKKNRRDKKIDFDWSFGSPFWRFRNDYFSIRWSGMVIIPNAGVYEFYTNADDGSRLWVDDIKLVDDWVTHPAKMNSGKIQLTAGKHKIRMEYFEKQVKASVQLLWRYETDGRPSVIPKEFLRVE